MSYKSHVSAFYKTILGILAAGTIYWLIGHGFGFGHDKGTNGFVGVGSFALDITSNYEITGSVFVNYVYQVRVAVRWSKRGCSHNALTYKLMCCADYTILSTSFTMLFDEKHYQSFVSATFHVRYCNFSLLVSDWLRERLLRNSKCLIG